MVRTSFSRTWYHIVTRSVRVACCVVVAGDVDAGSSMLVLIRGAACRVPCPLAQALDESDYELDSAHSSKL